jgi:hypothetical protein
MINPFIEASELSDDELFKKIQECQKLLYSEMHWGHTNVVNSIRSALDTYEAELQERMFMRQQEELKKKNPDGHIEIGTIEGGVEDYDEEKHTTVEVKRHKDL